MKRESKLMYYLSIAILIFCFTVNAQEKDSLKVVSLVKQTMELLEKKEYEKSRDTADRILKIDNSCSLAYILLGNIYAKYAWECSTNISEFNVMEWSLIYCLSFDMFEKAKQLDVSRTKNVDNTIRIYLNYLPTEEELFIPNDLHGKELRIDGWVDRKTKFRRRSETE
ncbi:hypothetical protein [Saccharicrinis aurantiacus]|uniref:hypothetical protein n=1 Tax=Saccharicrinis aurantiacus TaxID=1849719 RepID=UPI00094FA6DB|nr:hypothetical protein [Saccharicrinis aurantiacus]